MSIQKIKYYSCERIWGTKADYLLVIGERSNGKTTSFLLKCFKLILGTEYQMAYIRRWEEDFRGNNARNLFNKVAELCKDEIIKKTKGEYNSICYYSQGWYLCNYDEIGNRTAMANKPFCLAFALTKAEHYKSSSYDKVKYVIFDEFLTRDQYLIDEFVTFMHLISTIVRLREDVRIIMLGNTVNQYAPYWKEMGITNVAQMKKGDLDMYTYSYGDNKEKELLLAIEMSDMDKKSKEQVNKYYAFNNPKLKMITGEGNIWQMEMYPHLPYHYKPSDIKYMFFICFDNKTLQCEVIKVEKCMFIYIHRKTTPIKADKNTLIYQEAYDPRPNYRRRINKPFTEREKKIYNLFSMEKVFYQDNSVGELVRNYMNVVCD